MTQTPETEEPDNDPDYRGTYELTPDREVLFTKIFEINTADLPRWEPTIVLNPRWFEDDVGEGTTDGGDEACV